MGKIPKKDLFEALIKENYFPRQNKEKYEIPPIFSTESITLGVAKEINEKVKGRGRHGFKLGFDCVTLTSTRFDLVPRVFSIPFPKAYIDLCVCIRDNWSRLKHVCDEEMSAIKPELHSDNRIIVLDYGNTKQEKMSTIKPVSHGDKRIIVLDSGNIKQKEEKAWWHIEQSFSKKFGVYCDIADFFPSIYTHSIGWGAVGIEKAKKPAKSKKAKGKKKKPKWYNTLDKFQRSTTRGETIGIPIGPATSNIIAELILQRIDKDFKEAHSSKGGLFYKDDSPYKRYIDDYIWYAETKEQAEEFRRWLRLELRKYGLSLNDAKTYIFSLPNAAEDSWKSEISSSIPSTYKFNFLIWKRFLDYAVSLSKKYPDKSVMRYAITCLLDKISVNRRKNEEAFGKILGYTLNIAFYNPSIIPILSKVFTAENKKLWSSHGKKFKVILHEAVTNHRSDIACWVLYLCLIYNQKTYRNTAKKIIDTEDCFSMVLLYLRSEHDDLIIGYAKKLISKNRHEKVSHELDRQWLLLYQLFLDGKIRNPYSTKDKAAYETFEILKGNNISFIKDFKKMPPKKRKKKSSKSKKSLVNKISKKSSAKKVSKKPPNKTPDKKQ